MSRDVCDGEDRRLLETHHFVSSFGWQQALQRDQESYSGHHRKSVDPAPERPGKRRLATAGSQACSTSLCNLSSHSFGPCAETGIGRHDSLGHGFSRVGGHSVRRKEKSKLAAGVRGRRREWGCIGLASVGRVYKLNWPYSFFLPCDRLSSGLNSVKIGEWGGCGGCSYNEMTD